MEEAKRILNKRMIDKRREVILNASVEATRESKEGKTFVAETAEDIKEYFLQEDMSHFFGINPDEVEGLEFQKKVRNEWK